MSEEIKSVKEILEDYGIKIDREDTKGNYITLCPFHNDKNPSFSIKKDTGLYNCWSCHSSGSNIISFIAQKEGITYSQAKKKIQGTKILEGIKSPKKDKKKNNLDDKYNELIIFMRLLVHPESFRLVNVYKWIPEFTPLFERREDIKLIYDDIMENSEMYHKLFLKQVTLEGIIEEVDLFSNNKYIDFVKKIKEDEKLLKQEYLWSMGFIQSETYQKNKLRQRSNQQEKLGLFRVIVNFFEKKK